MKNTRKNTKKLKTTRKKTINTRSQSVLAYATTKHLDLVNTFAYCKSILLGYQIIGSKFA